MDGLAANQVSAVRARGGKHGVDTNTFEAVETIPSPDHDRFSDVFLRV
jgi:hypothetical protein